MADNSVVKFPHSVHIQFKRVAISHIAYFMERAAADALLEKIREALAEPPYKNDRMGVIDATDDKGVRFSTRADEIGGAYALSENVAQCMDDRRQSIIFAIEDRRSLLADGYTEAEIDAALRALR